MAAIIAAVFPMSRESNRFSRARNHLLTVPARCCATRDLSRGRPDGYGTVQAAGRHATLVLSGQTALNIVWTLLCGFLVMFMQAGFALVETGPDAREERRPHDGDELPRLRDRHPRLLGARLRPADGRRRGAGDVRQRRDAVAASSRSTSPARTSGCSGRSGFFLTPGGLHLAGRGAVPVPDGVHGHHRDDPDRARWPSAGSSRRSCSSAS